MYGMFRDMVLDRRNMKPADEAKFADGRVFTGRQALKNGLIDEIGGETEAITWLENEKDVRKDLTVRKVNLRRDVDNLFDRLDSLARKTILSERLTLDGLISVWHPQRR
jgi:protease-4